MGQSGVLMQPGQVTAPRPFLVTHYLPFFFAVWPPNKHVSHPLFDHHFHSRKEIAR